MKKGILILAGLTLQFGCQSAQKNNAEPIGYLGFQAEQIWAIQFNDCGVVNYLEAKKYQWFDRTLESISCYQFTPEQNMPAISVYAAPDLDSQPIEYIARFSELELSESGWGTFPNVYQTKGEHWLRIKEGWIYLSADDVDVVQYYPGQQNAELKQVHDQYYADH